MKSQSSHLKVAAIYLIKLLITCAFLYWALSQIDDPSSLKGEFFQALKSPLWVAIGLAFAGLSMIAGALRYYILLRAQSIPVSFFSICKLSLIAAFFNIASLGVAAGDAVKLIGVMRRHPHQKITITMVLLMDHLVGFVSGSLVFLIFAWSGGIIDVVENEVVRQVLIYGTVFQLVALLFISLMFFTSSEKRQRLFESKLPRLAANQHVKSVVTAVHVFQNQKKVALAALAVSITLSLLFFMSFDAALRTVNQPLPVGVVFTVMPVVDVASSLPISISGLGVREKTFEFFLSEMAGISSASAVSASLIGFLFHVFWGLVGGLLLVFEKAIFTHKQKKRQFA